MRLAIFLNALLDCFHTEVSDFDPLQHYQKILDHKRHSGLSWKQIAKTIGGYNQIFITTALLGNMPLPPPRAARPLDFLVCPKPRRGCCPRFQCVALKPSCRHKIQTLYRFYEAILVFGPALKATLHEEFGDGIMSAIDFVLGIERGSTAMAIG